MNKNKLTEGETYKLIISNKKEQHLFEYGVLEVTELVMMLLSGLTANEFHTINFRDKNDEEIKLYLDIICSMSEIIEAKSKYLSKINLNTKTYYLENE